MSQKAHYNKKLLAFFIAFFIVITFLAVYGAEHYNGHDETVELEQYCKISDNDLVKDNTSTCVYFITWGGSPTGDAGSWALYEFLNEHGYNLDKNDHISTSQSMANYEYNNTPGVIFNNSTYTVNYNGHTTIIKPVYLYGENLTNKTTIATGLQELKVSVPNGVYNEVKVYTTEAIVDGLSIPSDNISQYHHINSVTLINGPAGAYIFNGYLINPTNFNNNTTPDQVITDLRDNPSYTAVKDAVNGLETYIKDSD
jgi:hypothetical protein